MYEQQSKGPDNGAIEKIMTSGAGEAGITLPPGTHQLFEKYFCILEERGKSVNLTAISGAEEIARLHFLDSLMLLKAANFKDSRVIDVGSGAGFPGLPLKIAEPSIKVTLLDATGKRVMFLRDLCAILKIEAEFVHARAEDAGRKADTRERYDIAVSRAVANLSALSELCLPLVKVGGIFIAMKAVNSNGEIEEARSAIEALGAELRKCYDYKIPGTDIMHRAVVVAKVSKTPDKYPRRFARIQNAPL